MSSAPRFACSPKQERARFGCWKAPRIQRNRWKNSCSAPVGTHETSENLGTRVEFENTNFLGYGKKYTRFMVPGNALMYKGYDLNHSYEDCDVFVSLAKMKEHITAGITLSMKNCFGMTPCTIYGDGSGVDEPSLIPKGGRGPFHAGNREPSKSAPQMINPNGPKEGGYVCLGSWRTWWRPGRFISASSMASKP